jgi:hypothetical protein
MAYERKINNAGLFVNSQHSDKSDLNGQIDIACPCGKTTAYWMNAWRRVTQAGSKYLSLSLKPKDALRGNGQPRQVVVADDDL